MVEIQTALKAPALHQPPVVQAAFAVIVAGEASVIATLNTEIAGRARWWPSILAVTRTLPSRVANPASGVILGEF